MTPCQQSTNLTAESVLGFTFRAALKRLHSSVDPTEKFIYADRIGPITDFLGWEHAGLLRAQITSIADADPDVRLRFWDSFETWLKLTPNNRVAEMFARAALRLPQTDRKTDFDMLEALR